MSSPLRQALGNYAHLRRLRCNVHVRAIRPISSTARLKETHLPPTLKPEVDVPKADETDSDPYEPVRTREEPALLRPVIFTLGVGICTFAGAAYLTQRESQELAQTPTITGALVGDLRHERIMRQLKHANATFTWLQEIGCPAFIPRSYAWLGDRWLNSSDGERAAIGLVAVNTLVFLAWQIPLPAARFFMVKHFMHHPLSGRSYTLLTSVFSHMVSYFHTPPSAAIRLEF
jgi:rhomboid-like protein